MIKNHEERGGMEDLIKYEFIEKYLNENADTKFVGDLIDRIQADTDESWKDNYFKMNRQKFQLISKIW